MTGKADTERYFIASVPPSPYFEEVLKFKNHFKTKYQSKAALNSPPHITLHMPFEWKVKAQEKLISSLETFFKVEAPVEVTLKNFGSFSSRVIFVNVINSESLDAMQKRLTQHCKRTLNLFNADYQDRPFHAHMTVAFRDLKKQAFELAWQEFKTKTFEGHYATNQISLLKHVDGQWEVFWNFYLNTSGRE